MSGPWIDCAECLPPEGEVVIVTYHLWGKAAAPRTFEFCSFDGRDSQGRPLWWFRDARDDADAPWPPTHWMRIPEVTT